MSDDLRKIPYAIALVYARTLFANRAHIIRELTYFVIFTADSTAG